MEDNTIQKEYIPTDEKIVPENLSIKEDLEETTVTEVEGVKANQEEKLASKEEVYDIQDFINNCKALGYRREVVSGALFNCEKTKMTKTELKERIKKFLGKKVE
ncbi:hypothetical protein [Clostridium kluyveri]|uniref:YqzN/YkzM domain-containing protein n=1 Tax=Clostridium kluyveri TaxID=1534 RepID=A0A1L5FBT7_CLOKL|nr:hypothetical protein [Clostridium kluyveri]APM40478.1 hypothetical protein BS101_17960 [Clostridium kluyveri]